jgi:hypothetical protein
MRELALCICYIIRQDVRTEESAREKRWKMGGRVGKNV